ncbi:hypothetical protein K488DRAFT_90312 [Vararia minispora EC-137]|uniref:Uncharacterized protein n=1 Tax=Vararia minispora EC-137 TaxID=1314806 RepID=A0ACB8Q7X5_9AGAM|nr:hypothetical protein K488DRAFT_90312 [Vararia minispora EC-137]
MKSSLQDFTDGSDWKHYYVSRFVDRDMMQRYLGWGIGHRNPPDFPHEAHDLVSSDADRVLEHDHGHRADDGEASHPGWASRGQMPEDVPDVNMAAVEREGSIDEGEDDALGVRAEEGEAGEDEDEDEDEDADAPNGGLDEGAWEDSLGVFDF